MRSMNGDRSISDLTCATKLLCSMLLLAALIAYIVDVRSRVVETSMEIKRLTIQVLCFRWVIFTLYQMLQFTQIFYFWLKFLMILVILPFASNSGICYVTSFCCNKIDTYDLALDNNKTGLLVCICERL